MLKYVVVLTLYLVSPESPDKVITQEVHGNYQCQGQVQTASGGCEVDEVLAFEFQTLFHCQKTVTSDAYKSYIIEKFVGGDVQFVEMHCKPIYDTDSLYEIPI